MFRLSKSVKVTGTDDATTNIESMAEDLKGDLSLQQKTKPEFGVYRRFWYVQLR